MVEAKGNTKGNTMENTTKKKVANATDNILFGVAYYDEYMPYDRIDEDVRMMKEAGINVVRIAESTWSTLEPRDGEFNFYYIDRMLKAFGDAGIAVIVGTPTYAIPPWMVKKYPDILIEDGENTNVGHKFYGARQIMDITHPGYLFHSERVIRVLMEHVCKHECVIGYQLDNETKHYGTAGARVQGMFFEHLREKFHNDIDEINQEYGFAYWSNRVDSWDELPDVRGTINGSYKGEFEKFRRGLVTKFLAWQADIVNEYRSETQFVTQNFDYEWIGYSGGVQPDVNHFEAAKCLTKMGCDIYYPSQSRLTGREIAFCSDLARSIKQDNFLVIETDAQGNTNWMPYPGQLILQAFSLIANGADSVMYWHWHSMHNACETYWKGILSQDLKANDVYREAAQIGNTLEKIGDKLVHIKKNNEVAVMVSNEALTGLRLFPLPDGTRYNEVVHWLYDALYEMNIECDFVPDNADEATLEKYKMVLVPALYTASEKTLNCLRAYVEKGGYLISTFKTAFTNENLKVYPDTHPKILSECFGSYYQHFSGVDENYPTAISSDVLGIHGETRTTLEYLRIGSPENWIEIDDINNQPENSSCKVLARYDHPFRKQYAAITENNYGKGTAVYIGCMTDEVFINKLMEYCIDSCGLCSKKQCNDFPVISRDGINQYGKHLYYYFNYSGECVEAIHWAGPAYDLLNNTRVEQDQIIQLGPWGFAIFEEE